MSKNKWWLNGGRGSGRTFRLLWETYENKIAELKKENAELKEGERHYVKVCKELAHQANVTQDRLTKAKGIIGNLYEMIKRPYQFTAPRKIQSVNEAEQFLQEIEK